jgi:hypothetical protein
MICGPNIIQEDCDMEKTETNMGGAFEAQGELSPENPDMIPREVIHAFVDDIINDGASEKTLIEHLQKFAPGVEFKAPIDPQLRQNRDSLLGEMVQLYPHVRGGNIIAMVDMASKFSAHHKTSTLELVKVLRAVGKISEAGYTGESIIKTLQERYNTISLRT